MVIEVHLDYSSESVICFDPEKVILKLQEEFPETSTDWKDQAEAELQSVSAFLQDRGSNLSKRNGEHMVVSIRRKTWQNGPAFLFKLHIDRGIEVSGWARRYRVGFESEADLPENIKLRLIRFLEGLGLGKISFR
jgi:hypothetical protein